MKNLLKRITILLNLEKKGKTKMDYETENDALERKVNDLEDKVRRLDSEITDYMFECNELRDRVDDAEFDLEEATKALDTAKNILQAHPDDVWKWFCDSFDLSYYDKHGLMDNISGLIENKLKKSTYYES